jgi:hypothetical protein
MRDNEDSKETDELRNKIIKVFPQTIKNEPWPDFFEKLEKYLEFWNKMTKHPDLWKIQMTDASGEGFAGQTPLHNAIQYLTSPEYLVFWKGYPIADATWEYKSKIPKSFIETYEEDNP